MKTIIQRVSPLLYAAAWLFVFLLFSCKKEPAAVPIIAKPDLVLQFTQVTKWDPTMIRYSFIVKNIGRGWAHLDGPTDEEYDNVYVQAFISTDSVYDATTDLPAGGTILGLSPLGVLHQNETFSGQFHCSIWDQVQFSQSPFFILLVDWQNSVEEENEENNIRIIRFK